MCPTCTHPDLTATVYELPKVTDIAAAKVKEAGLQERIETVRAAFDRLPGWELEALGAYFAYVRHPFGETSAWRVAEALATKHGLMCLPGPAFAGEEAYLRIAFANVDEAGIVAMEERLRAATP